MELELFAGGKNNAYAKNRAEAKERQKWYKKSHLIRKYKKDLKSTASDSVGGEEKTVAINEISSKASPVNLPEKRKFGSGEKGNKRQKIDPFAKEKKIAQAEKDRKSADFARIAAEEKERRAKINHRKKISSKLAQRDSRGRPLVRNSINLILEKLQRSK